MHIAGGGGGGGGGGYVLNCEICEKIGTEWTLFLPYQNMHYEIMNG